MVKFAKLKYPTVLAPMSGYTDVAFRALARQHGAGLTFTEFVSSSAIINAKQLGSLQTDPIEKPVGVQIYGTNEKELVQAARVLEEKFDVIDINCGCPAYNVIKAGAGSAMLESPDKIGIIVNKLVSAVSVPVTVKVRLCSRILEIAKTIEKAGAAAITVHGRTRKQGYSGKADWNAIKEVKRSVGIPVIGNGDVSSPELFVQRLNESGVDAIMIGRGALGNPFLFRQINDYIRKGEYEDRNPVEDFFRYLRLAGKYGIAFNNVKKHALCFTHGAKDAAVVRRRLTNCESIGCLSSTIRLIL